MYGGITQTGFLEYIIIIIAFDTWNSLTKEIKQKMKNVKVYDYIGPLEELILFFILRCSWPASWRMNITS